MAESALDTITVTQDRDFYLALAHVNFDGKENHLFHNPSTHSQELKDIVEKYSPVVGRRIQQYKSYWHPYFASNPERDVGVAFIMLKLMAPSLGGALMRNVIYLATYFAATTTKEDIAPLLQYETEEDKGALSVLFGDYPKLDAMADAVKKIPEGGASLVSVAPWLTDFLFCCLRLRVSAEHFFVNADVLSVLTEADHQWLAFKKESDNKETNWIEQIKATFNHSPEENKNNLVRAMLEELVWVVQNRNTNGDKVE